MPIGARTPCCAAPVPSRSPSSPRRRAGGFRPPGQPQLPEPDQRRHARRRRPLRRGPEPRRPPAAAQHQRPRRRRRGLRRRAVRAACWATARSRSTRTRPPTTSTTTASATSQAPAAADGKGAPRWKELSQTGRFEWHDHRMHWMSQQPPERVRGRDGADEDLRLERPGRGRTGGPGAIAGTLFWTPQPAAARPRLGAIVALRRGADRAARRRRDRRPAAPPRRPAAPRRPW